MNVFNCRWTNCISYFGDIYSLENHVINHIGFVDPTSRIRACEFKCGWLNCDYPPNLFSVDALTLIRHLKYHIFIEYVLYKSQFLYPFPLSCPGAKESSHHIPSDFACFCNFKTDSFLDMCYHIDNCVCDNSLYLIGRKMFPCALCLSVFTNLYDLLNHCKPVYTDSTMQSFQTGYCCQWIMCDSAPTNFETQEDFLTHVLIHIRDSSSTCLWIGCPDPKNLSRAHILMHAYAVILRDHSIKSLQDGDSLKTTDNSEFIGCKLKTSNEWVRKQLCDKNYDGLICNWVECGLKFENPVQFSVHIVTHSAENQFCMWNDCYIHTTRMDKHIREIHSIPKFICPFCLEATYRKKYLLINHLAPDLEDIIGDSDEENQELFGPLGQHRGGDYTETVTLPELIKRFKEIWQNEKLSPELMSSQTEVVSLISKELTAFEEQIAKQPKGDLKTQLMKLQVERLRYLLTDYIRIRIRKIELYTHHVITEERERSQNEEPHLSPAEFNFAKTLHDATQRNFQSCVLDHLPINIRKLDPKTTANHPNLDSYVFCQIKNRIEIDENSVSQGGQSSSTNMLTLMPGEIHLLPYRVIRQHTGDGSVILL